MFTFDSSIETGNRIIDNEHRQLIDAINKMLAACAKPGSADAGAKAALQFVNQYIGQHFSHEQSLQRQYQYPDYERHKGLHEGYKKVVRDLTDEYIKNGSTPLMISKLTTNVGGWLINHIKREDKKLAAYIRTKTGG